MRWITIALVVLLGLIQAGLWIGDGGMTHAMRLQQQAGPAAAAPMAQQKLANARLLAEIEDLKRGLEMVEERARAELGLVKPDEVYVQYTAKRP